MTSASVQPSSATATHPLLAHAAHDSVVAWRHGAPIRVARFLADADALAAAMPPGRHVLNTCSDRYRFAVGLAAALISDRISLLPSMLTADVIDHLRAFAPDAFCLCDAGQPSFGLPSLEYPDDLGSESPSRTRAMPSIADDRTVAWLFTSGSTGRPQPHRKTWGPLVRNVAAEAAILGLDAGNGRAPTIVATVPAQHMYGFESTLLVAWQSGAAFSAARPLYPADIVAAIDEVPTPRMLVTTPFHLRTLIDAGVGIPPLVSMLSATAPLSVALAREAEARTGAPLIEIYGSTETGQIASRRPTDGVEWTLFPSVRLESRDGRVWASGGHVESPIAMGDVIETVDSNRFVLHGRSADMINVAGRRSSIAYLNHQLLSVAGVVDGVFHVPDDEAPDGVTRLSAVVVAPGLDAASLKQALRAKIEPAFMPRRIVFVDELPRNTTGKLPQAAISALLSSRRGDDT